MTQKGRSILVISILSALLFFPIYYGLEKHSRRFPSPYRGYARHSDLKQIGLAIHLYAESYHGHLPPTLTILCPRYLSDPRVLASPGLIDEAEGKESWYSQRFYYLFEGASVPYDGMHPSTPLVINRFLDGDDVAFAVLYADGHVDYVSKQARMTELLNRAGQWRVRH
jgi:hypothetical protein